MYKILRSILLSMLSLPAFAAVSGSASVTGVNIEFAGASETNWVNGELVLKFTSDQSGTFTLPGSAKAQVLLVGGGGAGGSGKAGGTRAETSGKGTGGGGGAGAFVEKTDWVFADGTYLVNVGKGGEPAAAASGIAGGKGDDTIIKFGGADLIVAKGGGGGGVAESASVDSNGGSGGGGAASYSSATVSKTGGSGVADQGYSGGDGLVGRTAGGGGGAGGKGSNGSTANAGADGGLGKASKIWNGTNIFYAAGGGSGSQTGTIGLGGSGIGGNGGGGTSGTGTLATKGAKDTGSGGGGGTLASAGAAGAGGVVLVRISAALAGPLVKPTSMNVTYDGAKHTLIESSFAYTIKVNGSEVTKVEGENAGTYVAKVKPNTGFAWQGGGDDEVTIQLTISKAQAYISDLKIADWTAGAAETPSPTCTTNIAGMTVFYTYGKTKETATTEKPTEPGNYFVFAEVKPSMNWDGASESAAFTILEQPATLFEDSVALSIAAYTPSAGDPAILENFPYRVVLSANSPVGFDYTRAGADGHDICFADANGNILPHEVVTWDPTGESLVYVRVSKLASTPVTIYLYWKPVDGKTTPAYNPNPVFEQYSQAQADGLASRPTSEFGVVEREGKKIDYWAQLPTIDKTSWGVTTDPTKVGTITSMGSLRSGRTVKWVIYNAETAAPLEPQAMPMNEGVYYILFSAAAASAEYIEPADQRIDIRVIDRAPYDDLRGGAATITLGGRVLLMNADKVAGHALAADEGQAYWQVRSVRSGIVTYTFNPFWTHEGEHDTSADFPYLFAGIDHDLKYIENEAVTNILWRLRGVRIGNTFSASTTMMAGACYLPASATALGISTYARRNTAGSKNEIGQLVMRNLKDVMVYSPCYTNGIGTIYFDAVNSHIEDAAAGRYKLVVEVAECTKDENPEEIPADRWVAKKILPLRCKDGKLEKCDEVEELTLDITKGGTDNNFYRVCVKLNAQGTMCFRIRRTESVSTDYCGADYGRFILLDNLIVSYPMADVKLEPYGRYDESRSGKQLLGWEGVMANEAFPSVGNEIFPRAKTSIANYVEGTDPSTYIQLSKFHYRWHYLEQASNNWNSVDLRQANDFVADKALELPKEAGDVEFWYETYTKIPFYDYFDYSGLNLNLGELYSEEVGMLYYPANALEGGRCFFRLRPGKSDWNGIKVHLQGTGFGANEEMELVSDHTWRALVKVPTNVTGEVNFRFSGAERWTAGGTEAVEKNTIWYPGEAIEKLPNRGTASISGSPRPFIADGATGYMEFQFNDETGYFTLGHAEYQGFNVWHDAKREDQKFIGTYAETSGVSVAAMVTTNANMASWETLRISDENWNEPFDLGNNYEIDAYKKWVRYSTHKMPAQWNGDNGMFVDEALTGTSASDRQKSSGIAWQMQGSGLGSVYFTESDVPNGLDTVKFRARLAQSVDFDDIAFCYADGMFSTNNYTFLIPAILSTGSSAGKCDDFAVGASMSVFGYYIPMVGAYEFRVSRDDNTNLRFSIYKWHRDGWTMKSDRIATHLFKSATFWSTSGNNKPNYFGMLISIGQETMGEVTIIGALTTSALTPDSPYCGAVCNYRILSCVDNASPLTGGSVGVLSAGCKGQFLTPRRHSKNIPYSTISGWVSDADGKYVDSKQIPSPIPGTRNEEADNLALQNSWAYNPARMEIFTNPNYGYQPYVAMGFRTPSNYGQTVDLYLKSSRAGSSSSDDAAWTKVASKTITGYGWQNYSVVVRTNMNCHVMLKSGEAPAEVAIHKIEQTGWNGADMGYMPDREFIYTQANVSTNIITKVGEQEVTNRWCTLQPARAVSSRPLSIRAPMLDHGLGMLGFRYKDVKPGAEVWVQLSTNEVLSHLSGSEGLNNSLKEGSAPGEWETVRKFTYDELAASDEQQCFVGMHDRIGNPLVGVMRLVVAPEVIDMAATKTLSDPGYGAITITDIWVQDEPALDTASWFGWNLRVLGDREDSERRMYLPDPSAKYEGGSGLAAALNNSTTADIPDDKDSTEYELENPTIQSPVFRAGTIGSVRFLARVYDNSGVVGKPATVTLYGLGAAAEGDWSKGVYLERYTIDSPRFTQYEYRAGKERFASIRLVIDGVKEKVGDPARVLLDEVIVSEKTEAAVGFVYARPFRSHIDENVALPESEILSKSEQPLTGESWGIQARIRLDQFDDEVDTSWGFKVAMRYYIGAQPWGYESWKNLPEASREVLLTQMEDPLVYRSSFNDPRSFVKAVQDPNTVVQYMLFVQYKLKGDVEVYEKPIEVTQVEGEGWTNPRWYSPIDKNLGKNDPVPYTILDAMSPGRVWINELNYNDGRNDENGGVKCVTNQFIEVAVPWGVDMTGWYLQLTDMYANQIRLATFGLNGVPSTKRSGEHCGDYGFMVLQSPGSKVRDPISGALVADATWTRGTLASTLSSGELQYSQPYQIELYRPSGILEHQFVVAGTNEWRNPQVYFDSFGYRYEGTNLVNDLNALSPSPVRFFAGEDVSRKADKTTFASLGVTGGAHGEQGGWSSAMKFTPGHVNEGQEELSGWYIRPNGASVWVYARVEDSTNVRQHIGEDTLQDTFVIVPSGSATNIFYDVAPWFMVDAVAVNEAGATNYTFTGKGANARFNMNNITETIYVVAKEKIDPTLIDAGLDVNDRYTPAIMNWLRDGSKSGTFKHPDGPIINARYRDINSGDDASNDEIIGLKGMYWLDIDPTEGGWWLRGGFNANPVLKNRMRVFNADSKLPYVNPQLEVQLYLSNDVSKVVYAPRRLQGVGGEQSDKPETYSRGWTSETFKVEAKLNNGNLYNVGYLPFRWFVFDSESFLSPAEATILGKKPYTTVMEITDPFSFESPGNFYGWYNYRGTYLSIRWNLTEQLQNTSVEMLRPDSTFDGSSKYE